MNKIIVILAVLSSLSINAMFKGAVVKTVAASMAAGTAMNYPKIKQQVETWKELQQHKKDVKRQNTVRETSNR